MDMPRDDRRFTLTNTFAWTARYMMWLLAFAAGTSVAFATAALFAGIPALTMVYSLITLAVCVGSVRFYATQRQS